VNLVPDDETSFIVYWIAWRGGEVPERASTGLPARSG
jgi:hypothetical protein